jgi:hypothetical protein
VKRYAIIPNQPTIAQYFFREPGNRNKMNAALDSMRRYASILNSIDLRGKKDSESVIPALIQFGGLL